MSLHMHRMLSCLHMRLKTLPHASWSAALSRWRHPLQMAATWTEAKFPDKPPIATISIQWQLSGNIINHKVEMALAWMDLLSGCSSYADLWHMLRWIEKQQKYYYLWQTRDDTLHKRNELAAASNVVAQEVFGLRQANDNCWTSSKPWNYRVTNKPDEPT